MSSKGKYIGDMINFIAKATDALVSILIVGLIITDQSCFIPFDQ